ncbi:exportin-2-like [Andrographis paniculata]|uniref:exportin-2-like n=1 Tax=Andrographis paniculata TaxID=175694 RepID=UPI0021E74CA0|nr:exportin-2-like [Andrographis paniculata]
MEWNPETLQFLSQCFLNTLSPLPEPRRKAEAALAEAAGRPNYGLAVLRLVAEPSVDEQIRQSAAVNFKNHLKVHWALQPDDPEKLVVPDQEKEQIKALIVTLMVNASPKIQAQVSEALTIIGKHDFPKAWPSLLPELVVTLDKLSQGNDYVSVNGVLATINSLFKKFRYQFKTNELLLDLKYCLDNFAKPLLEVFKRTAGYMDHVVSSAGSNPSVLKGYIESQRLCCRIFYSLNFMELPEFFEDHMDEWMIEFKKYLTVKYPALEASGKEGLALVDELRAAVCENISLYMEKEEEIFQKYLSGFVDAVWGLLVEASNSSSREKLTVTAIKFLTTVSTSVHHTLFSGDNILPQICQSVVIPNVMLRDEDEELFEMNYVEFIRRDMEGSDLDTRRRIACELLKGIALNYKEKVTGNVSSEVQKLLATFSENPSVNWKQKDCAIYLVVSLATKKAGGNSVSTDLVDVESFFGSVIVPELRSQDVDGFPMLKAGALKFFTMFKNQISKPVALALLPDVVRLLVSESNVVHSYAATCIEKLLLVKDGSMARYSAADISPFLLPLMTNLFAALQKPESEENQYVMKCIMRVLGVANVSRDVALPCINGLASFLNRVCENPKNPIFNHYLFESVALLIKRACEQDPSIISDLETSLLPSVQVILSRDITEFFPYAFQLLAQLVDLNVTPLPGKYMDVFALLLLPESWKKSANVPALVRLLQAFLRKAPYELNQQGRLSSVLGIFNTLVSSPSTDEQGFYVLNTVIDNLGYDVLTPYISHIWVALFNRLQQVNRTVKFIKSLVIFMSLFLVKHGPEKLVGSMNAVQPDVFRAILEQFWIPNLKLIVGSMELKLTAVASTRLLCESLSPSDSRLWGKMLDSIVTLISRPEEDRVEEEPEIPDFGETVGYNATFVHLYNAGRKEEDPLPDIKDPKQYLVASLANLSARSPGTYPSIINQNLDAANQAALLQLCNLHSVTIV